MKRHSNLWPQVISFAALLRAAAQACKGKRFRPGVAAFHFDLEPEPIPPYTRGILPMRCIANTLLIPADQASLHSQQPSSLIYREIVPA
jgi:hypothetical protein